MGHFELMRNGGGTQADLQRSWHGPRWWQKLHGMDPQNYGKWLAAYCLGASVMGIGLGILLLVSTKQVGVGVFLTLVGCGSGLVGLWRLRRPVA